MCGIDLRNRPSHLRDASDPERDEPAGAYRDSGLKGLVWSLNIKSAKFGRSKGDCSLQPDVASTQQLAKVSKSTSITIAVGIA